MSSSPATAHCFGTFPIFTSIAVKQELLEDDSTLLRLAAVVKACSGALQAGGKVIFAGNGRSFANAQHRSAEFTSRFRFDRAPLAAVALGTNNSAISAIGNDYDYEQVFARELHATGEPRDVLIAISTTGKRPNIIRAVEVANSIGLTVAGLAPEDGGGLVRVCESISVPASEIARIQECYILLGHIMCGTVEGMVLRERTPRHQERRRPPV